MWTRTGTILYSAPEIFQGGGYNEKGTPLHRHYMPADIWSTGVILFQMLCEQFPYHQETNIDTIESICSDEDLLDRCPRFRQLDFLVKDFLRRILKKDPAKRISATGKQAHIRSLSYKK
jgi:calcium-dependent protein kinase